MDAREPIPERRIIPLYIYLNLSKYIVLEFCFLRQTKINRSIHIARPRELKRQMESVITLSAERQVEWFTAQKLNTVTSRRADFRICKSFESNQASLINILPE